MAWLSLIPLLLEQGTYSCSKQVNPVEYKQRRTLLAALWTILEVPGIEKLFLPEIDPFWWFGKKRLIDNQAQQHLFWFTNTQFQKMARTHTYFDSTTLNFRNWHEHKLIWIQQHSISETGTNTHLFWFNNTQFQKLARTHTQFQNWHEHTYFDSMTLNFRNWQKHTLILIQ
jgi:hypothetical protein